MPAAVLDADSAEPTAPAPAQESVLAIRRWLAFADGAEVGIDDLVYDGPGVEAVAALCAGIVLDSGDERRVATLLAAGADCVFVGEAALQDSALVDRLLAAHGAEHIGIHARLGRQAVSWSFETVSNADFKTLTPSCCEPAWELLRLDGTATGTLASWWLMAMRDLGASRFVVRVDIADDADLNLCAGLVEELGDAVWIGPLSDSAPQLADWVDFGGCRRLVLPAALFEQCHALLTRSGAAA